MTAGAPGPGPDEICLSAPGARAFCQDREHRSRGRPAEVVVTFGRLADPGSYRHGPGALWPECWGRSYAMCAQCWERTRRLAAAARPGLAIRDARPGPG